ncbi:MAG: helix-turn-helix domain-containing protein [Ignavibacteriaceae bacterium]|nr:helix-turn-helix domain-containing protein [Ignavibacteriaceae bacterium]NUM70024.1 helix-turn-helix domain-containing protein [Ignavibacteriaceae bacterium]
MTEKSDKNRVSMTDMELRQQIGAFVRFHRLKEGFTQAELAKRAGLSRSTLVLLEKNGSVTLDSLIRVLRMLDKLYIMDEFRVEKLISPLLLAKLEMKERRRVRRSMKK